MSDFDKYADLIGRPFEIGGRGPDVYDCSGLAMEVARRNGVRLPAKTSISSIEKMAEVIAREKSDYEECKCEPLCGVAFHIMGPDATHIGVVLEDGLHFIHTMKKAAVSIQRLSEWQHRIDGFFKYVG